MTNSPEFTRLMNKLDKLEQEIARLSHEQTLLRRELNLAVIDRKLNKK